MVPFGTIRIDFNYQGHAGSEPRKFHVWTSDSVLHRMAVTRGALEAMAMGKRHAVSTEMFLREMAHQVESACLLLLRDAKGPTRELIVITSKNWRG